MPEELFLSASDPATEGTVDSGAHPLAGGERVLWSGRCAVAEYAFDEPASLPRWTLPEETEVVVTEQRVVYRDQATMDTGELHWPWPQHLRVQPGNRDTGRSATVTQIQLVCAGPADTFPALVFAGGDLATVGDADRFANVLRMAIARYRVENAKDLGITASQARMLSRLLIGPEFRNYQGGDGQTVSLLGALPVQDEVPLTAGPAETPLPAPGYPDPVSAAPAYPPSAVAQPYTASEPAPLYAASEPAPFYATSKPAPFYATSEPAPFYAAPTSYEARAPHAAPPAEPRQDVPMSPPPGSPAPHAVPDSAVPYVVPEPYRLPSIPTAPIPHRRPTPTAPYSAPDPISPAVSAAPAPAAPAPAPAAPAPAAPAPPAGTTGRARTAPGRPLPEPDDLDTRAADLAARVAMLVSGGADPDRPTAPSESPTTKLSAYLGGPAEDPQQGPPTPGPAPQRPSTDSLSRAEAVRISAARMVGNSARRRGTPPQRQPDDEIGATTQGRKRG